MGGLPFWEEGDADGDEGVVVGGDEAVEEGAAEALNGGGGACEPGLRDSEDFAIAALGWKWWEGYEGGERREE